MNRVDSVSVSMLGQVTVKGTIVKYAYSTDEERYHGEFDTREDAAREFFASDDDAEHVYVGEIVDAKASDYVDWRTVDKLLEDINQRIDDVDGELVGDWPVLQEEPKKELAKIIGEFLDKHAPVDFFNVTNVTTIRRGDLA